MNKLFFGDNLQIMRDHIPSECIDLIYLDPPFNSKANYNVLFKEHDGTASPAQITAFIDTWHWGRESEEAYSELISYANRLSDLIQALRSFLGTNDMMAYLTMMAVRLVELHRVLKNTGSIYLHCDPTASHYLKLVMDAIFGIRYFSNEIIWSYKRYTAKSNRFQRLHDVVFFYGKSENRIWNHLLDDYSDKSATGDSHYKIDEDGVWFRWQKRKGKDPYKIFLSEGKRMGDVWDIPLINASAKERLGYPTQKPEALLERIIQARSNEGDLIMDPFCGCGTTVAVAERLNRQWIGIDMTHLAITLIRHRLEDAFGLNLKPYQVIGEPKDLESARALAQHDRYQFQYWAFGKVAARPVQSNEKKKGADKGIDGVVYFLDDNSGIAKKIIVQVKSGAVKRSDVAILNSDRDREKAMIGVFITLQEPTRPMIEEAIGVGFYEPVNFPGTRYPRIQIITIEELLHGKPIEYPRVAPTATFNRAQKKITKGGEQGMLDL